MKNIIISLIITVAMIGGVIVLAGNNEDSTADMATADMATGVENTSILNGVQVVTIRTEGSHFLPDITTASANIPTVLKINTNGTFGCKTVLVISSLDYRGNLPSFGETIIDIPPQQVGAVIHGTCGMGNHNFSIYFS